MAGILIIFLYLFFVFVYFARSRANTVLNSAKWFIFANLFLVIVYMFGGVHYYDKLSYYAMSFMLINIISLLTSEHCGYVASIKKSLYIRLAPSSLPRKIRIIGFLCIIGSWFYITDIMGRGEFSIGLRQGGPLSPLGALGSIFLCTGLFVWLYSLYIAIETRRYPSLIGCLCLLFYVSADVITAARSQTITMAISTFIVFLYAIKKSKFKVSARLCSFMITIMIFSSFIFGYIYLISTTRSVFDPTADMVVFSESWFGAQIDNRTMNVLEQVGPLHKPISDLLFYYSHQLVNFSIYYERYSYPPTMGLGTFHYITRRFETVLGPLSDGVFNHIDKIFTGVSMSWHTWGTYQKNMLVDYGKVGAIIVNIILGFLMGISRRAVTDIPSPINVVLQALICTGAILAIHSTPFASVGWAYPFYMALLFKISLRRSNCLKS